MQKDCPMQVNGKCLLSQMDCSDYPFNLCSIFQQVYQLGKEAGYKEADAMNYYEGSGIGGFHDY